MKIIAIITVFYLLGDMLVGEFLSERVSVNPRIVHLFINIFMFSFLTYKVCSAFFLMDIWNAERFLYTMFSTLLVFKAVSSFREIQKLKALKLPYSLRKKYKEALIKYVDKYVKARELLEGSVTDLMNWFLEVMIEDLGDSENKSLYNKKINAKYKYKNLLAIEEKYRELIEEGHSNLKELESFIGTQKEMFTSLIKDDEEKYYAYLQLDKISEKVLKNKIFILKEEPLEEIVLAREEARLDYLSYLD